MLLNLGHTFACIGSWAGYSDRLLHGEAVAIGMAQAFRYSERVALCPAGTAARVEKHLQSVGLPTRIADIPGPNLPTVPELLALMAQDKKVVGGKLTFILVRGIGRAFVTRDVTATDISHSSQTSSGSPAPIPPVDTVLHRYGRLPHVT